MPRLATFLVMALLVSLLCACGKAPSATAPQAAEAPAPTSRSASVAVAAVIYQCHSATKSRDIFMRFDADGSWEIGADANSLKPTGMVILFSKAGTASWTKQNGNITETDTFDKNTGEWDWDPGTGDEGTSRYLCKPI